MIGLIWAQSLNGVIGRSGLIPWHLPEDQAHFRRTTMGCSVVMGKRTWDSLPGFLDGRRVIVVSRLKVPLASTVPSVEAALAAADRPVWVAGGGEIYRATIGLADRLVVTEVDLEVEGDTHAPVVGPEWRLLSTDGSVDSTDGSSGSTDGWLTSRTGLRYRVRNYERSRA